MLELSREQLLILIASPIYVIVIGAEIIISNLKHKTFYTIKGVLSNLYLMLLNMGLDVVLLSFTLGALTFFTPYAIFQLNNPYLYWLSLLIIEDFLFYLLHLVDHKCRLFWAVHVTHHSSEEFNLTVGFRSSVFQPLYRFIYFIPLAIIGFKPIDIIFMYSATQIWGIIIHTQYIKKLGWLEYILSTPSHHRVHHASNAPYLDKNMGMVFIIWDKLFGTFQEELSEQPVAFGLTKNLNSYNPINMVFHEWKAIVQDIKQPISIKSKINYLFNVPGWSHDGSRKTSKELEKEYREMSRELKH